MITKLNACGIVAEYNPFHNGHLYHLSKALEMSGADVVVCAMSGNFTQRGEPALLDKWTRAENAVRNGINLVVEIPAVLASSNAGTYAKAGVDILEGLGCEFIAFGTEKVDMAELEGLSKFMSQNENAIEEEIKKLKKAGVSYPKAREEAIRQLEKLQSTKGKPLGGEVLHKISLPNNILALEYIKYMKAAKPLDIERIGYYNDERPYDSRIASASAIRRLLREGEDISDYVPKASLDAISDVTKEDQRSEVLYRLILNECIKRTESELNQIYGAEEGLGSIMKREFRYWNTYRDAVDALKSKAYTRTRVQRTLLNLVMGVKREDVKRAEPYIRILAFDEKGAEYLRQVKNRLKDKQDALPLITNINKALPRYPNIRETLTKDIIASDIYNLISEKQLYFNSDFVKFPLKISQ